jgi:hypothetical protein
MTRDFTLTSSDEGLGIFLFTTASRTSLGPTQPPIQLVPGAVSWSKATGTWSWPLNSTLCRGKDCVALYLHSPNTPSWRGAQLKHRDKFTSAFLIAPVLKGWSFDNLFVSFVMYSRDEIFCLENLRNSQLMVWGVLINNFTYAPAYYIVCFSGNKNWLCVDSSVIKIGLNTSTRWVQFPRKFRWHNNSRGCVHKTSLRHWNLCCFVAAFQQTSKVKQFRWYEYLRIKDHTAQKQSACLNGWIIYVSCTLFDTLSKGKSNLLQIAKAIVTKA